MDDMSVASAATHRRNQPRVSCNEAPNATRPEPRAYLLVPNRIDRA